METQASGEGEQVGRDGGGRCGTASAASVLESPSSVFIRITAPTSTKRQRQPNIFFFSHSGVSNTDLIYH